MLASAVHILKQSFAHTHIPWARGASYSFRQNSGSGCVSLIDCLCIMITSVLCVHACLCVYMPHMCRRLLRPEKGA